MLTTEELTQRLLLAADELEQKAGRAAALGDPEQEAKAAALRFVIEAVRTWAATGEVDPEALLGPVREFALGATKAARAYPKNEILEGRRRGAWGALFGLVTSVGLPLLEGREPRLRCRGLTKAGAPCRTMARRGQEFCWRHEPGGV
jgi:hypothetical protein